MLYFSGKQIKTLFLLSVLNFSLYLFLRIEKNVFFKLLKIKF